jgi:hypothetical protein
MQRTMKMAAISCHATSLGNVGSMNPPDARAPVIEFIPAVPSVSLLQVVSELDDRITMPVVWQRSETSQAQVDDYLARLSQTFVQLAEAGATNKQAAQPESWAA